MQVLGEIRKNQQKGKTDEHRKPRTVVLYLGHTHPRGCEAIF